MAGETGQHSALGAPMLRGGEAVAVIVLRSLAVTPFSASEVKLVETFADQAAIAIENVRLFNETKEALDRQTAIGEVLSVISQSAFELEPMLKAIAASAKRLGGAAVSALFWIDGKSGV